VAAQADLGGLGQPQGPAAVYTWTPLFLLTPWLPALALLPFLLMPSNRRAGAGWIWAPVGFFLTTIFVLGSAVGPPEPVDLIGLGYVSVAISLAIVWLLAHKLSRPSRFLTWLLTCLTASGLALAVGTGIAAVETSAQHLVVILFLIPAFGIVLGLAVLCSRREFRPLRFSLWLAFWSLCGWQLTMLSFAVIGALAGGQVPLLEVSLAALVMGGLTFLLFLPFLVLSAAHPLYRARLRTLFWPATVDAPAPDGIRGSPTTGPVLEA
jgi:uncharacterized membrane protein SirB2